MHCPFNRQCAKHVPSRRPDPTEPNVQLGVSTTGPRLLFAGRRTTTTSKQEACHLLSLMGQGIIVLSQTDTAELRSLVWFQATSELK